MESKLSISRKSACWRNVRQYFMEKSYINEELSLFKRMKSVFLPLFVSLVILFTLVISFNKKIDWKIGFIIVSFYVIVFAIYSYFKTKSYVYAIRIIEKKLIIDGQTFNTKWTDNLDIDNNLYITLKGEAQGKTGSEYVLILKSKNKTYKINSLYNWDYFKLIELFKELKMEKGEKIISDEKFLIDRIEKTALGFSSFEINFGD